METKRVQVKRLYDDVKRNNQGFLAGKVILLHLIASKNFRIVDISSYDGLNPYIVDSKSFDVLFSHNIKVLPDAHY